VAASTGDDGSAGTLAIVAIVVAGLALAAGVAGLGVRSSGGASGRSPGPTS
jgi:hypothetical protein